MRMDADRRIDAFIFRRDRNRPFKTIPMRVSGPDVQNRAHASRACALDHLVAVGVILRAVNVCVRINEQG